ncbi:MAG: class II fructose-bisphosphate aldolase [Actinobacteria bacterium]|nr:class II fructose-bisphosphate aldolase [Actinomycetota bacterium]
MALINLKKLLNHASKNKYAVGAFNITSMNFIDPIIEAAIQSNSPVIMQLAEVHFRYLNLEHIAPAVLRAAREVSIPVCINLDHGKNFDTIMRAIRAGFTSVMFDGSSEPLEVNIARTKEIVKIAHSVGVGVEGEIGNIGGEVVGTAAPIPHAASSESFTKVEDAVRFYEETGVDALAISVGNVHGTYKGEPNLDFERIDKINKAIPIPLVLHGGSGISDADFKKAVSLGISKINFYTEMSANAVKAARLFLNENPECISYGDLSKIVQESVKKTVMDRMEVFGSINITASDKTLCISCEDSTCGLTDPKFKPEAKTVVYNSLIDLISRQVLETIMK